MNILLVIKRFDFGGAENHVCDLANFLTIHGHKVVVAGRKGRQTKNILPNVKFINIYLTDFLLPINVLHLVYLVFKYKIKVIHCHQRLAIVAGGYVGLATGRKVVATIHGRTRHDLRSKLSRCLIHRIIFVSRFVYEHAIKKYKLSQKAVLIPNGITIKETNRLMVPYRICHISRIDSAHFWFIKEMITAVLPLLINKFPQIEFYVIGDGSKIFEINELAIDANQRFKREVCKIVGYTATPSYYYQSANLILGVGRVALEACASAAPIILVNSKRFGGLLTQKNYNALKCNNFVDVSATSPTLEIMIKSIEFVFANQKDCAHEAKKLATQVQMDFSMDRIIDKTVTLYNELQ
jgi:glycosyltransferase involved in cell wall biosynthesis